VADVTIPDNAVVPVGRQFDKTWRLRNSGTCIWDAGYELRYVRGDALGANSSVAVPHALPGHVVEATVPMVAPATPGTYRGEWQVCAVGGDCFGERVYVLVSVRDPTPTPTNTPVPTSTPKPISTVTFQDIRRELDRLSGETASAYKRSLLGQRVEWAGYAYGTLRDGGITVEMDSPDTVFSLPDVNLAWAPGNEPAAPARYEVCLFRGDIAAFSSFLGHLEVDLADGMITPIEDARSRASRLPTYDALARDTEEYMGDLVTFRGEVAQVSEVSDLTVILRINVTRGTYFWTDAVWVNYTGPRVLEEDIVDVLAVVVGRRTYTAVLGNSVTIPELAGLSVSVAN